MRPENRSMNCSISLSSPNPMTMRPPPFFERLMLMSCEKNFSSCSTQPRIAFGILLVLHILCRCGRLFGEQAYQLLGLAYRKAFLDDAFEHAYLHPVGAPAMALACPIEMSPSLSAAAPRRQLEQPHVVRDGRAFLAHLFREGVLRQVALVDQALHSERDLYGIEILALDVLHQGHGVQVLVVHLADVGGQGFQTGFAAARQRRSPLMIR